jgi:16S rRNA (guanine(966)-N(2))-methyltransferase RsmD
VSRIVAGTLGGRRLATPPGLGTRPTSDRVREALFSALDAMTELRGSRFADLYAGSGAVGLEAASRGAAHVLLVESDPRAARTARDNITALGARDTARLITAPVAQALATPPEAPYDVVFADPPYAVTGEAVTGMLEDLRDNGWLAPDALVAVERATRDEPVRWPEGYEEGRARRYGEGTLWYGHAAGH